jgi:hypothetical protein
VGGVDCQVAGRLCGVDVDIDVISGHRSRGSELRNLSSGAAVCNLRRA